MTNDKKSKTKYILLVGDGMGDYPLPQLDGKTPLEAARTPNMDRIAACGIGLANTIPDGLEPGERYGQPVPHGLRSCHVPYGERPPLKRPAWAWPWGENEVAFRMNLVTLNRRSDLEIIMVSNSAGASPPKKPGFWWRT